MENLKHLKNLKQCVEVWNKWRVKKPQVVPNLADAELILRDLTGADLAGAKLSSATLSDANLTTGYLFIAKLSGAYLIGTNLSDTNMERASIQNTNFQNIDLSKIKGLDKLKSKGHSTIDHRTLIKSKNLPDKFLRDCGLPEQFIEHLLGLVSSIEPIQFYSYFISHSSKDEEFATRLYSDLQAKGIRC